MSTLKAGAARSNITPPLGTHIAGYFVDRRAEGIGDELFAKSVVLENGDTSLAFCVLDLIMATREHLDVAKARAAELTGIPAENVFISCTHTHFGPSPVGIFNVPCEEAYMQMAMERAGDSIKRAQNSLRDAEVAHASGSCPDETHNRRWHMSDGSVQMNPGFLNPERTEPAGPTDPEVGLLVVRDLQGDPIAALANYSLHYVGGPYANLISADYFGYFDRALQRLAGGEFVAIMANGFCGDINNCDFNQPAPEYPHPFYQAERVGNRVAAAAYYAWLGLRDYDRSPTLAAATETVGFVRREPTPEELQDAKALWASKNDPSDADWMYAGEMIAVSEEPVERPTPIMGARVGDLGVVGLPGEIFVEYGLQIKQQSPFARTFTIELANDYIGYCPTDKALEQGSYETRLARTAKAAKGTEELFVGAAGRVLQTLAK
ncbi:MAG: neutral/alkaline non-lysosomal ceramidase N-terminal domain-containing protein [Armatimonadota bacterium]